MTKINERSKGEVTAAEPVAMSEASLVADLKAGKADTAEFLVRAHTPWMLVVARRVVGDSALAEDCVQEAFFNAFRKIGDFEERSSLKSWLHRIVVNQALMKLRGSRNRKEAPIDEFLNLTNVSCDGVTLRGTGLVSVTIPEECGTVVNGSRIVHVDLGPSPPANEPAALGLCDSYGNTESVQFSVPEPAGFAGLAACIGMLGALARRRERSLR